MPNGVLGPERKLSEHCVEHMIPEDREKAAGHLRTNPNPRLTSDGESARVHVELSSRNWSDVRSLHGLTLSPIACSLLCP